MCQSARGTEHAGHARQNVQWAVKAKTIAQWKADPNGIDGEKGEPMSGLTSAPSKMQSRRVREELEAKRDGTRGPCDRTMSGPGQETTEVEPTNRKIEGK